MSQKFYVSPAKLTEIKVAAKSAGLSWQSIAARPASVNQFLADVAAAKAIDVMRKQ
jgi:hypothetical protein